MGWDWDHQCSSMAMSEKSSRGGMGQGELPQQCGAWAEEPEAGMSMRDMLGPGGADTDVRRWEGRKAQAWQGFGLRTGMTTCQRLCPKWREACGTSSGQCKQPRA